MHQVSASSLRYPCISSPTLGTEYVILPSTLNLTPDATDLTGHWGFRFAYRDGSELAAVRRPSLPRSPLVKSGAADADKVLNGNDGCAIIRPLQYIGGMWASFRWLGFGMAQAFGLYSSALGLISPLL